MSFFSSFEFESPWRISHWVTSFFPQCLDDRNSHNIFANQMNRIVVESRNSFSSSQNLVLRSSDLIKFVLQIVDEIHMRLIIDILSWGLGDLWTRWFQHPFHVFQVDYSEWGRWCTWGCCMFHFLVTSTLCSFSATLDG